MFRRKFIDRLRNKYQTGGKKEPYISIGGKSINTPINSKVGFGGKISLPFLESIDHGKSATGLRGELDASFTRGDRKLASQLEAETSVGELPKDMATSPKTWNAAVGLRGYHNRAIGRNRGLSLNSSVGAGLGSGEKHGAFMYQDPNGFGGATYNHGMERDIKPYADANMSLLKHGQHRGSGGTNVSGGINASYGTKFSPNPGLRAGVEGSFGPFKGNVGYDFTNKSPRVGISANFQTGGLKYNTMDKVQDGLTVAGLTPALGIFPDALNTIISAGRGAYNYATGDTKRANSQMGDLALNAASMIPAAGQAAGVLKLAKTANTLNKVAKVVKPLDKVDALNSANNLIKSTVPSTNNTVGAPLRNTTPKPTNSFMPTSMSNNFAETGGVRHQEGGTKLQERLATSFSGSNIPARINMELLNEAVNNQYLDDRVSGNKSLNNRVSRGKYETIKKQTGGTRLPGGEMQPIPGSDAVQFNGQSHDQGGIMVDSQTEVEGGETMDKVNIAKKGGKRDYFFSSHLKEGGRSYADMHKDILANGGNQEEINMLAKMQEVAAGRDPKQVAKLGGIAKYQSGGAYPGAYTDLNLDPIDPAENFVVPQDDPFNYLNVVPQIGDKIELTTLEEEAKKDQKEMEENDYVVKTPEQLAYEDELKSLEKQKKIEAAEVEYAKLYNKAKKKADKGRGVPTEAYVGMGAQMLPSMYAFLHKQKKPEDATYTQGFKSPIHSQTVKAQKLDRVNYNDKRSQLSSSIRGANKFIETSGGGPANMANLQASLAKDIMGQMQINAEETKANVAIDNREKQLAQQAALDNVKRSQAASTMNAQLARIEAARRDTIEGGNVTARNQWQSDQELNKMNALTSTAQGIAGGAGDIMSYKANERMARAIGSEGIYQRDIMRDFIGKRAKKDGIPGLCGAGECTDKQINSYIANKGVFQNTEEE